MSAFFTVAWTPTGNAPLSPAPADGPEPAFTVAWTPVLGTSLTLVAEVEDQRLS